MLVPPLIVGPFVLRSIPKDSAKWTRNSRRGLFFLWLCMCTSLFLIEPALFGDDEKIGTSVFVACTLCLYWSIRPSGDDRSLRLAFILVSTMYLVTVQAVIFPFDCISAGDGSASRVAELIGADCFEFEYDGIWMGMATSALVGLFVFVVLPPWRILALGRDASLHDKLFKR